MANAYRKYNHINDLIIDGVMVTDEVIIKDEILDFFESLCSKDDSMWLSRSYCNIPVISIEDNMALQPFLEEEVIGVIDDSVFDKSSRSGRLYHGFL